VDEGIYLSRELSWLKFDQRVLEEAERPSTPLAERLNFLSIYQRNLDEFFRVRVAGLMDRLELEDAPGKGPLPPDRELSAVLERTARLERRRDRAWAALSHELAVGGFRLLEAGSLDPHTGARLAEELLPRLSPRTAAAGRALPFLPDGAVFAAALLEGEDGAEELGLIPCAGLPPLLPAGDGAWILSQDLALRLVGRAFPGRRAGGRCLFRIVRSAAVEADLFWGGEGDFRAALAQLMERRRHLAPVRLEAARDTGGLARILGERFGLPRRAVSLSAAPLGPACLSAVRELLRPRRELFYPPQPPQISPQFRPDAPILDQIRAGDKLLAYPYHSMEPFLLLLRQAAIDPAVVSIQMTLYRLSPHSQVAQALAQAARQGKRVLALVELRARFDEEDNIGWSRQLEAAGCAVRYGLPRRKVHAKLCRIVRRRPDGTEEVFTQIGTGNYNEDTAQIYTDFSLFTAEAALGREAGALFQALERGEAPRRAGDLLTAPHCLRRRLLALIDAQAARARAGQRAYIGVKVNALTDRRLMDALVRASQAGVEIDLLVRGICALRPGVSGETDRIRVRSIVGRYLEHARLYLFGPPGEEEVYLSSADWMPRNMARRVEAAVRVKDPTIRAQLLFLFRTMFRDDQHARQLGRDGIYRPVPPREGVDAQALFWRLAHEGRPFLPESGTEG